MTASKSGSMAKKSFIILTMEIRIEHDVVYCRQRARQLAHLLGFDSQDQTRIATAVSEIARNAYKYAGGGKIEFELAGSLIEQCLMIRISDHGGGIPHLDTVLGGRYVSETGMGLGIIGSKKLMDVFEIGTSPDGTVISLGKSLSKRGERITPKQLSYLVEELSKTRPDDPFQEVQLQNQDLLRAMQELRSRDEELTRLNHELEATNRGVVALYAELDEKADYLQRANEVKTRFLSNMTHEFRTPLNSILSLSRLLLDRLDGPLSVEQEKQVNFVRKSAEDLSELVNDLLDIAKVEAGKVQVRPSEFSVSDLFSALRGMLKPLLADNTSVKLVFDDVSELPRMETDEAKVSQILRNFISNALKFTERGEVRVSAKMDAANTMVFEVADTGIGIAKENQERIFEEFSQIESPLQGRSRGTGLGLPLTRKLADLLGGSIMLQSELHVGSRFSAVLPMKYRGADEANFISDLSKKLDPTRFPVLVIEDNRESVFVYEKYLRPAGFQVLPARTLKEARQALKDAKPVAVIADILLEAENTWSFITELKQNPDTAHLPVIVITMVDNEKKARAIGVNAFHTKPIDQSWLVATLLELNKSRPAKNILVIDDDEVSRYLLKGLLSGFRHRILEAGNAYEGIEIAKKQKPDVIFLDLYMPEIDGFKTLSKLKENPETEAIPVIIHSSRPISPEELLFLEARTVAILPKESTSREDALVKIQKALGRVGVAGLNDERA